MGGIISTISIEILAHVTLPRADVLHHNQLQSHADPVQLPNLHKGKMTVVAYFQKVKGLTGIMASTGKLLFDEEIILYILAGLDESYDSLVDALMARANTDALKLSEV